MQWIINYQLFLFDFDGLLVDTESLHHQAYIDMCAQYGFNLKWNFQCFSEVAHYHSHALRDQIYKEFPELYLKQPNWAILYEEKKRHFLALIDNHPVSLLPGVADLLVALQAAHIRCCVVTHSAASLINRIRQQNPILESISYWITREDYSQAKPHPECYQSAIAKYAKKQDSIIGFEDSPRGLHALLQTQAKPVLVCPLDSIYLKKTLLLHPHVLHYPSLMHLTDQNSP